MTLAHEASDAGERSLPERVVSLLSRPILVDLPEMVARDDLTAVFGPEADDHFGEGVHEVDDERILRFDLTVPLLLVARGRPAGTRLIAAGKVSRVEELNGE